MNVPNLKRNITFTTAFTTIVGSVIASGIFFKPTAVFSVTSSPVVGIAVWILGGVIALLGGLTIAELGSLFPQTGGLLVYLENAYGKTVGFLVGWIQCMIYMPATLAALAIIFATQLIELFHLQEAWKLPIACLTLTFVTLVNILGNKYSSAIQNWFTILKFIPFVIILIAGLFYTPEVAPPVAVETTSSPLVFQLGGGLLATLFAFDGWLNVTNLAGEIEHPEKNVPRSIILGITVITAVYVIVNIAYLNVATPQELAATPTPAAFVATRLFPGIGSKLITIGILISVFGGINGYTMSAMRVPYVMAKRNWLPFERQLTYVHEKSRIPIWCGLFVLLVSLILVSFGSYDQLADLIVVMVWSCILLAFFAVFLFRKTMPDTPRPYKVPLYPLVPLLAIIGGLFVIITTLMTQPWNVLLGVGITLSGLPIYWYKQKQVDSEEV